MNGPYAHDGMREPYEKHTRVVEAVRKALGKDIALMIDVQYMWPDAETALRTIRDWAEFDIFFLETPLWIDKLDDYAACTTKRPCRSQPGSGKQRAMSSKNLWIAARSMWRSPISAASADSARPRQSVIWQRNVAA